MGFTKEFTILNAFSLRDRIEDFLRGASESVLSFALTQSGDNYWRDSNEAIKKEKPEEFRPTVTFYCLEAQHALLNAIPGGDLVRQRLRWAQMALRALHRLHKVEGRGLEKIHSTMSGGEPNILTATHIGMVLARLQQSEKLISLNPADRRLVRYYQQLLEPYLESRLKKGARLNPEDHEHPYLMYRIFDCLLHLKGDVSSRSLKHFAVRLERNFDRLASAVAYRNATPAEGVDYALLWATAALSEQIPVSLDRLRACLIDILELSRPSGDWPLGHALSVTKGIMIPSGEVAGPILNSLLLARRWKEFPTEEALKTLAYTEPLTERLMRDHHSVGMSRQKPILGWTDSRLVNDPKFLQSFTTASHIMLLTRIVCLLRETIRALVVRRLGGQRAVELSGPGFDKISEVDDIAPVGAYLWESIIMKIDPLAAPLEQYRRNCKREKGDRKFVVDQTRLNLPNPREKNVSIILYGPPGTGKTTYVKALARQLQWPLITITPGNFTKGGAGGVETAAQELFDLFCKLDRVVILLDECDELFRRRDQEASGARTLLSFLTASMLPKLANLHDRGQLIFIVATNFIENLDLAAIRGGRIDHHVAVPPPDEKARRKLLKAALDTDSISLAKKAFVAKALAKAARGTQCLTRDEVLGVAYRLTRKFNSRRTLPETVMNRLLEDTLDSAQKSRLNTDRLLVDFYSHMKYFSAPVVEKSDVWRMPNYIRVLEKRLEDENVLKGQRKITFRD